jgi:hypothetical protein
MLPDLFPHHPHIAAHAQQHIAAMVVGDASSAAAAHSQPRAADGRSALPASASMGGATLARRTGSAPHRKSTKRSKISKQQLRTLEEVRATL